ncbi:MAG: radical SAM protein [Chloroflexota bacterium]
MAEFSPKKRVTKELSTPEWKSVIDKSWAAGVPHLIFTGGEATLRPDLSELLQKAEMNGQVTGLLTNGKKFVEKNYLLSLLESGLDHITTILPGTLELDLKSIQNVILEDIYFTVHATINTKNKNKMVENLKLLDENGVKNISLSIYHGENRELLKELSEKAYGMNFHISGGLPVPYSESNPASVEDKDEINLTDDNALYVQPDGDVLSYQGSYENILGNILTDNIQTMFKKSKEN